MSKETLEELENEIDVVNKLERFVKFNVVTDGNYKEAMVLLQYLQVRKYKLITKRREVSNEEEK